MTRDYLTTRVATQFGSETAARKELLSFLKRLFPEYAVRELGEVAVVVESRRAVCKVVPVENGTAAYLVAFRRTPGWLALLGNYRRVLAALIVSHRKDDKELAQEVRSALVHDFAYQGARWQTPKKDQPVTAKSRLFVLLALIGSAVAIASGLFAVNLMSHADRSLRMWLFLVIPVVLGGLVAMRRGLQGDLASLGKLDQAILLGSRYHDC